MFKLFLLTSLAKPFLLAARQLHETRCAYAKLNQLKEPDATRTYHDLTRLRLRPSSRGQSEKKEAPSIAGCDSFIDTLH